VGGNDLNLTAVSLRSSSNHNYFVIVQIMLMKIEPIILIKKLWCSLKLGKSSIFPQKHTKRPFYLISFYQKRDIVYIVYLSSGVYILHKWVSQMSQRAHQLKRNPIYSLVLSQSNLFVMESNSQTWGRYI